MSFSSSNLQLQIPHEDNARRPRSSSEGAYVDGTLSPITSNSFLLPTVPVAGKLPDSSSTLLPPGRSQSSSYVPDKSTMLLNMVECIDFYDVGNVLGEIGILEQKVNHIDALCETDVEVFFIERVKLERLMKKYPVLNERMWKILGVHIASTLLTKLTEYEVCIF